MKKLFIFILIIPILFAGCEYRKFEFAPTIKLEKIYEIDQTGVFDVIRSIQRQEILDLLDIPEDAEITEVNIESISIKVVVLQDNEASAVSVSGDVVIVEMENQHENLFEDYIVPLVMVDAPWIGLNSLISDGVERIKGKLEDYLMGTDLAGFVIALSGDSSPTTGERIHTQIMLRITATVKYFQCVEVPSFIEGGDPC